MTTMRDATQHDLPYIESLRRKEGSALGFIPASVYEQTATRMLSTTDANPRYRWLYMRLLVVEDNGDLTGFCLCSFATEIARILQIVVQEDARRWYRATLMADEVEREAVKRHKNAISCRVAMDLESNFYWRALGYTPVGEVVSTWLNQRESHSKRPLWVYEKRIDGQLELKEATP